MKTGKWYYRNMKEYGIELVRGHILMVDDRGSKVLVDTGSPLSFHSDGVVAIDGETAKVPTDLMVADSDYVTRNVGTKVDGLVGMDLLAEKGVLIDVPGGRLVFGQPTQGMTKVPSRYLRVPILGGGYMSVEMEIRGKRVKVIVDTGAPVSYVAPSLTEGLAAKETVKDFNPGAGEFETPVFEFPAAFAGQAFEMRAGHLPKRLQLEIGLLGMDGVVGMELLRRQPMLLAEGSVWI